MEAVHYGRILCNEAESSDYRVIFPRFVRLLKHISVDELKTCENNHE